MLWRASAAFTELKSGEAPVCTPLQQLANALKCQMLNLPSARPAVGLYVMTQIGNSCKSYPVDVLILVYD